MPDTDTKGTSYVQSCIKKNGVNESVTVFADITGASAPIRAGYTFAGWATTEIDTTAILDTENDTLAATDTQYAIWNKVPRPN